MKREGGGVTPDGASDKRSALILANARGDEQALVAAVAPLSEGARVIGEADLAAALESDPMLLIATEEVLAPSVIETLSLWARAQPDWSALPVLTLLYDAALPPPALRQLLADADQTGLFVMILERPVSPEIFENAARGAIASRRRQFRIREQMAALRAAHERIELLAREIGHRSKNHLTMLAGLLRGTLSATGDINLAVASFEARLAAMGRSIDLLDVGRWRQVRLADLVKAEQASLPEAQAARIAGAGPEAPLNPDAAIALHMVLHELTTNAVKYGALSAEQGEVAVDWSIDAGEDGPKLRLRWRESRGPTVTAPAKQGFGARLLSAMTQRLRGAIETTYAADGVRAEIVFPWEGVRAEDPPAPPTS